VLRVTINGKRPLLLSSAQVEYFSAAFYLRNPLAGGLPQDTLSIIRRRFVGEGMQERIMLRNEGMEPISFTLGLEIGCDFADIMSVKEHDFALGDPVHAKPLPPPVEPVYDAENNQFVLADPEDPARTQVILSQRGTTNGNGIAYEIELAPRGTWDLQLDVVPSIDGSEVAPKLVERRFGDELVHVRDSLAAWQLRVPQLRAGWEDLEHSFGQSVSDLASLRMRSATDPGKGRLPAAGMPWFMTVFGRDTIITCLQTLLFGPELASTALRVLAELQAREDDPSIDAEPGKIVHEVRTGKAAKHWFRTYYGTVDATPLYLVLLSEVWRWTDDTSLMLELKEPALRALEWIDKWGDRDGDGFVEYQRRSDHGLENQSWKDSGDSQRFADGRIALTPIAPAEVQGYVYDAKRRMAELAREVWRDRELADRLNKEAKQLRDRFDESFWVEANGGYFALALDRDKQRVDSRCSNMGHLLWSGIVHPHRVDAVVDTLMGDSLWSGWGIRTMSEQDAAYNPLSYHNGTVWPHDNSLVAWGLARYGRWPEMQRIAQRLLQAARYFNYQLPEVFAGLRRSETTFPIAYPTAARPQAWAAGTPVLLLQLLLGLQPDVRRHSLETIAPPELPTWVKNLRLSGVRAFDRQWDVRLEDGRVRVEET
jgi:glycogen debranching enzyme